MIESSILISVIVPIYNSEKYIRECVDSLICQKMDNVEFILIDDGSTDSSSGICEYYKGIDNRIVVVHRKNGGVSLARQTGVDIAQGKYLLFVDSDDYIRVDTLSSLKVIIDTYNPDMICFNLCIFRENVVEPVKFKYQPGLYNKRKIRTDIFPQLIEDKYARYFPTCIAGKCIRKDLYSKNQVLNRRIEMGEDGASTKPCMYHSNSIYFDNKAYYYYRKNSSSITESGKPLLWSGPYFIQRHYETHINMGDGDLKEQVYRNTVHNLFNVAVSQFSRKDNYLLISRKIKKQLSNKCYAKAINSAHFTSLKGKVCKLAVKYKLCFVFYLRWLQRYGLKKH